MIAKQRQRLVDECFKRRFRVGARHGEPEGREIAEMVAKSRLDERDNVPRRGVGRAGEWPRHEQVDTRRLAIFDVEIPFAADRLIALHEQAGLAAHVPIEIFHAQLLAARRPGPEGFRRAHETIVGQDVHRHGQA